MLAKGAIGVQGLGAHLPLFQSFKEVKFYDLIALFEILS